MRILFSMSISGSIVLLGVLIFQPFWDNYRIFRLRYILLKICIVYFLCPFPLIKFIYYNFYAPKFQIHNEEYSVFVVHNKSGVLLYENRVLLNSIGNVYLLIMLIAFTFSCILIYVHSIQYFKIKRAVSIAIPEADDQLFKKIIKELGIKKKIRLSFDLQECRAFSFGIRKPFVIIPIGLSDNDKRIIFVHELFHIKARDTLTKFLVLLVICIHWFNPLVYVLMQMVDNMCEICCDEYVINNMNNKERKEYCRLLISLSIKVEDNKLVTPLKNRNVVKIKRRILYIMKTKRKSKIMIFFSLIISGAILFLGSIPVMAYEAPPIVDIDGDRITIENIQNNFNSSDLSFQEEKNSAEISKIVFEHQFIDEDGNIYNADTETQSSCQHNNKVAGTVQDHVRNNDGSCNLKIYEGERCVDCGKVIVGSLISSTYYTNCPH